jgi:hypothetical protein
MRIVDFDVDSRWSMIANFHCCCEGSQWIRLGYQLGSICLQKILDYAVNLNKRFIFSRGKYVERPHWWLFALIDQQLNPNQFAFVRPRNLGEQGSLFYSVKPLVHVLSAINRQGGAGNKT